MAELTAISLNAREPRTTSIRHSARAEAVEIAELIGSNIAQHWTPDPIYLAVHGKRQLIAMLDEMGCDDARAASLKKDELVGFTVEQCAQRGFAPRVLAWGNPAAEGIEDEGIPEDPSADNGGSPLSEPSNDDRAMTDPVSADGDDLDAEESALQTTAA